MKSNQNTIKIYIWAMPWQNQENECMPSKDSDQPGHPPSLIRVFAVHMKKAWVLCYPLSTQWWLIRLGGCPGWSKSSLGAHSFCWFCHVAAHLFMIIICQYCVITFSVFLRKRVFSRRLFEVTGFVFIEKNQEYRYIWCGSCNVYMTFLPWHSTGSPQLPSCCSPSKLTA